MRFVCGSAASWLRPQASLCFCMDAKRAIFELFFSKGGLGLRVSNHSGLRPAAI